MATAVTSIQNQAKDAAEDFLKRAHLHSGNAKVAADWTLAAKNAIAVAVFLRDDLEAPERGRQVNPFTAVALAWTLAPILELVAWCSLVDREAS